LPFFNVSGAFIVENSFSEDFLLISHGVKILVSEFPAWVCCRCLYNLFVLVDKVGPLLNRGVSVKVLDGFKLSCVQLGKLRGTFLCCLQSLLSFKLFQLLMFARFIHIGFLEFVKHNKLLGVEPLELDNNFCILLVNSLIVRDGYIDAHAVELSLLLLQESEEIFELCSFLLCCQLSDSQLELDDQFKFVHVSCADIQISFEHHVEQVIHVLEVIVIPFVTLFKLLPVEGLTLGGSVELLVVHDKLFFFREHVQLVTTEAIDVVVKVESSEPPLLVRNVVRSGVDI
jgi:hypothetical protein